MLVYKTTRIIDLHDWDNLVQETYGKPYSFQQQDGCQSRGIVPITIPEEWDESYMNDSVPEVINGEEMGVKFNVWLERDPNAPLNPSDEELKACNYYRAKTEEDRNKWCEDKSHINMFYQRNFYPNVQTIANDLHEKGLIEAGEYYIEIDW